MDSASHFGSQEVHFELDRHDRFWRFCSSIPPSDPAYYNSTYNSNTDTYMYDQHVHVRVHVDLRSINIIIIRIIKVPS